MPFNRCKLAVQHEGYKRGNFVQVVERKVCECSKPWMGGHGRVGAAGRFRVTVLGISPTMKGRAGPPLHESNLKCALKRCKKKNTVNFLCPPMASFGKVRGFDLEL